MSAGRAAIFGFVGIVAIVDIVVDIVDTADIVDIVDTVDIVDIVDTVDIVDIVDTVDIVDIVDTVDTLDTVHTVDNSHEAQVPGLNKGKLTKKTVCRTEFFQHGYQAQIDTQTHWISERKFKLFFKRGQELLCISIEFLDFGF